AALLPDRFDARVLVQSTAAFAHHAGQLRDITVGSQLGIARIEITADDAGLQRRLARLDFAALQGLDGNTDFAEDPRQPARRFEVARIAIDIQRTQLFILAVQTLALHQIGDQFA